MTLKKKKKKRSQILKSCDFQCYFSVNIFYPKYLNYRSKRLKIHRKNNDKLLAKKSMKNASKKCNSS